MNYKRNMEIKKYWELISPIPEFLNKYLEIPIIKRLEKISYFCGMDYASKYFYDFKYYLSRYDHSISTALWTWCLTKNKKMTIAALLHDVATPVFSHVIDYMNDDYLNQESTETLTEEIINNSKELAICLAGDNIKLSEVTDYKLYPLVDNSRPKLCADRIDGIILLSLVWIKNIELEEIKLIIDDIRVYQNEDNESEIGFKSRKIAQRIYDLEKLINQYTHSEKDCFMMMHLAKLTKYLIEQKYIEYNNLYYMNEEDIINIIKEKIKVDSTLKEMWDIFTKLDKDIHIEIPPIKERYINPLINGKRLF